MFGEESLFFILGGTHAFTATPRHAEARRGCGVSVQSLPQFKVACKFFKHDSSK